jgi:hypothetical protein
VRRTGEDDRREPDGRRTAESLVDGRRPGDETERDDANQHGGDGGGAVSQLAPHYFRNFEVVLSASTFPPVWHVGQ